MRVCVVGAGPSGLTTIKQLLDEGHDVTCFEKQPDVGGIWLRHDGDADEMKAFDDLILTISMKLMAFSDFPFQGGRVFCSRAEYLEYLRAYAAAFRLRRRIVFGTDVREISRIEAAGTDRWRVLTSTRGEATQEHVFDAVAVCAGPFQIPNKEVRDLERFAGEVIHSSRYRNNERFRGKRVLVVGLAESGADIVREISDVAAECTLSIRSYSYLLSRIGDNQQATDAATTRALHHESWVRATRVPFRMASLAGNGIAARLAFSAATKLYGAANIAGRALAKRLVGEDERFRPDSNRNCMGEPMLPKKVDIGAEATPEILQAIGEWNRRSHNYDSNWSQRIIYVKNASFIPNILHGKIEVNDRGIEKIDGCVVHFKDKKSKSFDTIVLCTGFRRNFAALGKDLAVPDDNVRHLYKHAFFPQHRGRVALIGFVRPFSGGIPICSEMQARYFALLCSDKIQLPPNVDGRIVEERRWEEYWTALSPRHTESVPSQIFFCDSIAHEIGCLMPLSELLRRPRLLVRQWFYPFNQASYRLRGPHADYERAAQDLLDEPPGPLTAPEWMAVFMYLSVLPSFMHPKYVPRSRGIAADALVAKRTHTPSTAHPPRSSGEATR